MASRTSRVRVPLLVALLAAGGAHDTSFAQLKAAPVARLVVSSPLDYEVFQRKTRLDGKMSIRGRAEGEVDRVDVRITGQSLRGPLPGKWRHIPFDHSTREFHADVKTAAGGFYEVEFRGRYRSMLSGGVTIEHVGVGEVFVVSGQSNSTNYGEVKQVTETGMVTTFSGVAWRPANDPQPGVQDNSTKGSFIPSFGDALFRRYGVPIGIASVGHGSTSVRQWLPAGEHIEVMPTITKYVIREPEGTLVSDGTLFNGMIARMRQLGTHGFRAVLWHQGESDSNQAPEHEISGATYERMLMEVIKDSRRAVGWDVPWFVAEASYGDPQRPSCPAIREAQRNLWHSGVAVEGPDTDTLTAAYRQNNGKGVHFNDAGLKAHGLLWSEAVESYLDRLLR